MKYNVLTNGYKISFKNIILYSQVIFEPKSSRQRHINPGSIREIFIIRIQSSQITQFFFMIVGLINLPIAI